MIIIIPTSASKRLDLGLPDITSCPFPALLAAPQYCWQRLGLANARNADLDDPEMLALTDKTSGLV